MDSTMKIIYLSLLFSLLPISRSMASYDLTKQDMARLFRVSQSDFCSFVVMGSSVIVQWKTYENDRWTCVHTRPFNSETQSVTFETDN